MGFLDRLRRGGSSDAVLDGVLLVPLAGEAGAEGERVLEHEESLPIRAVEDDEGMTVVPAFTTEASLLRWAPAGTPYAALQGSVLLELLAQTGCDRIVVDGAGPQPLAIGRDGVVRQVPVTSYVVPADEVVRVGAPASPPPAGLVDAVRALAQRRDVVREAHVYHFGVGDDEPQLTIGLVLDPGVRDEEVPAIVQSVGEELDPPAFGYESVDLQVLEGELLDAVRAAGEPVYARDVDYGATGTASPSAPSSDVAGS